MKPNITTQLPPINERILMLIDNLTKGNVAAFVRLAGISSHQVLNRIFSIDSRTGKYPNVSSSILSSIKLNMPNVNYDWLLTGEGEMLNTPSDTIEPDKVQSDMITIPANVWSVIEQQANSLTARDRQMDELISIIKEQVKKTNARLDEHAISAVAG